MAITSYNVAPYFDDYNVKDKNGNTVGDKNYLRILFQPGFAIQTREVNQLQSILQAQIDRLGSSFYREGEAVLDGESSFKDNVVYIEIQPPTGVTPSELSADLLLQDAIEIRPSGQNYGGTFCKVLGTDILSNGNLRIYINSITDVSDSPGTLLQNLVPAGSTLHYKNNIQILPAPTPPFTNDSAIATSVRIGYAFALSVDEGIYYVKGSFVHTPKMTRYWIKESKGDVVRGDGVLTITEKIVTSAQDSTLLDNSTGSYNFSGQGADRYSIALDIAFMEQGANNMRNLSRQSSNIFLINSAQTFDIARLFTVDEETIEVIENREQSNLEKRLARRTFEESGNYTLAPFKLAFREFYRGANITDKGADPLYSISEISSDKPFGVDTEAKADEKFIIQVEPSTAYVNGFRYFYPEKTTLAIDKARTIDTVTDLDITFPVGNFFDIVLPDSPNNSYSPNRHTKGNGTTDAITFNQARQIHTVRSSFINAQADSVGLFSTSYPNNLRRTEVQGGLDSPALGSGGGVNSLIVKSISYVKDSGARGSASNSPRATYRVYLSNKATFDDIERVFPNYYGKLGDLSTLAPNNEVVKNVLGTQKAANAHTVNSILGNEMLFKLPEVAIQKVNGVTYEKYKKFTGTITADNIDSLSGGASKTIITLSGLSSGESFIGTASNDKFDYLVIRRVNIGGGGVVERIVNPEDFQIRTSISDASSITLEASNTTEGSFASDSPRFFGKAVDGTEQFVIFAPVRVTNQGAGHRKKTITSGTTTISTGDGSTGDIIQLAHSDVIMSTIGNASGTFSSSDYTILDDGLQDPEFYRKPRLRLEGPVAFSADTDITYKYYTHGPGDYFTVNSYGDYANSSPLMPVPYREIPTYRNTRLDRYIDFRCKDDFSDSRDSGSINKGSAALIPNRVATVSYTYYQPRKDRIVITGDGEIISVKGQPSTNPILPPEPANSMTLYTYFVPPYTDRTKNIKSKYINNQRSTMSDIGRLKKRIEKVEYYSALSLLENDAMIKNITNEDGTQRFKNGFLVDNFRSDKSANPRDKNYLASSDKQNGIIRPYYVSDNLRLFYQYNIPQGTSILSTNTQGDEDYGTWSTSGAPDFYVDKQGNSPKFNVLTQRGDPTSGRPQQLIVSGFSTGDTLDTITNGVYTLYNPNNNGYPEYRLVGDNDTTDLKTAARRIIRFPGIPGDEEGGIPALPGMWQIQQIRADLTGYDLLFFTTVAGSAGGDAPYPSNVTTEWKGIDNVAQTNIVIQNALDDRQVPLYPDSTKASQRDVRNRYGWNNPEVASLWDGQTEVLFSQLNCSRTISVQPYEVTRFEGKVKLSPAGDEWIDTTTRPQTIIQDNSAMQVLEFFQNNTTLLDDVLGTEWNHIETLSQGTETLSNVTVQNGNQFTQTIQTQTTTEVSMEGTEFTLESNDTIDTSLGDRVTNINIVPFIRSRDISIYANGLKPNTRIYVFFDGKDVSRYVAATEGFKEYGLHEQVKTYNQEGAPTTLETGGAIQSVDETGKNHYEIPLYTTLETGEFFGTFRIPNNSDMKFRTGIKKFKITSSKTNKDADADTIAETTYAAYSMNQEVTEEIVSTHVPEIVATQVSEQTTIVTQNVLVNRWRRDPVAQTFTIPKTYTNGVSLTDVDVFFAEKPDFPVNVEVMIVPTSGGLPTNKVVPGSRQSLPASQVKVPANGRDETDGSKIEATTFRFDYPVYLKSGKEYALIIFSPSSDYRVWIATLGEPNIVNNNIPITTNSDIGVLCKSQTQSVWTADQTSDLMFRLNKGRFLRSYTFEYHTTASGAYGNDRQKVGIDQGAGNRNMIISSFNIASDALRVPNTNVVYDIDFINDSGELDNTEYGIPIACQEKKTYELKKEINTIATGAGPISNIVVKATLTAPDRGDGYSDVTPYIDMDKNSLVVFQNQVSNTAIGYAIDNSTDIQTARNSLKGFVTKNVILNNPADNLRVFLNTNRVAKGGSLEIYVKARGVGDNCPWEQKNWEPATLKSAVGTEQLPGGLSNNSPELPVNGDQYSFSDVEYNFSPSLEGITEYATKIVFTGPGGDSAKIVRAKDLRVIATS